MCRYAKILVLFFFIVLTACSSGQVKPEESQASRPEGQEAVFNYPPESVNKAATNALAVLGFDIQKTEPLYLEGYRPHKIGLFVGSGGETGHIWLEPLEGGKTRARVATTKSFVGYVGQKNWDQEILDEMQKSLAKTE